MESIRQIADEIKAKQNITLEQLRKLLETNDTEKIAYLHDLARVTARETYGNTVFIRGQTVICCGMKLRMRSITESSIPRKCPCQRANNACGI